MIYSSKNNSIIEKYKNFILIDQYSKPDPIQTWYAYVAIYKAGALKIKLPVLDRAFKFQRSQN